MRPLPGGTDALDCLQRAEGEENGSRRMSPRLSYIEKLRRIAEREKGMRRAFTLARALEAEQESDEQFCRKMRLAESGLLLARG